MQLSIVATNLPNDWYLSLLCTTCVLTLELYVQEWKHMPEGRET